MEFLLALLLIPIPPLVIRANDPAPGIWHSREDARSMDCVQLTQQAAFEQFPGVVPEPPARRYQDPMGVLTCTRRFMRDGERAPRDEAVLSKLSADVATLAQAASTLTPGKALVWHVDAFYPSPEVTSKIAVAARIELFARGQRVSDRVPLLAAGDIAVLGRMPPEKAYPLACARYFSEHSLGAQDAFLGLMLLDPRETELHAGVCLGGEWRWLR